MPAKRIIPCLDVKNGRVVKGVNFLNLREIWKDCDEDTLLVKVKPAGPVCHTGARTCFFERLEDKRLG